MNGLRGFAGLALAIVAGIAVSLGARTAFQAYYTAEATHSLSAAHEHLGQLGAALAELDREAVGGSEGRRRLEEAALTTHAALAPIVERTPLRGTFLDAVDRQLHRDAVELDEALQALARDAQTTSVPTSRLASRASQVVQRAALQPTIGFSDAGLQARADALWSRAYGREVRAVDDGFHPGFDALVLWRQRDLAEWATADRWAEMAQQIEREQTAARQAGDRFSALSPPPHAVEVESGYAAALTHAERGLRSLGEYVAGRAASPRPLRLADEAFAAYAEERRRALSALARVD